MPGSGEIQYLGLDDYLLVAEEVLDIEPKALVAAARLELAESALNAPRAQFGGHEAYPELATKAAVLCARLAKNHPLPDGNKRSAFLCLLLFVKRNGLRWLPSDNDPEGTVSTIEAVAAGTLSEEELAAWIRERTRMDPE